MQTSSISRILKRTLPFALSFTACLPILAEPSTESLYARFNTFAAAIAQNTLPPPSAQFPYILHRARQTLAHGIDLGVFPVKSEVSPHEFSQSLSAYNSNTQSCTVFLSSQELDKVSKESFSTHLSKDEILTFFTAHEFSHCTDGLFQLHQSSIETSNFAIVKTLADDFSWDLVEQLHALEIIKSANTNGIYLKTRIGESYADVYSLIALAQIQDEATWRRTLRFVSDFRRYDVKELSANTTHDTLPAISTLFQYSHSTLRKLTPKEAHTFSRVVAFHSVFSQTLLNTDIPLNGKLAEQLTSIKFLRLDQRGLFPSVTAEYAIAAWLSATLLPRFISSLATPRSLFNERHAISPFLGAKM